MLTKSNRTATLLFAALAVAAAVIGVGNYRHHMTQLRAEVESTFKSRTGLLAKFVSTHRDQVMVMRNLMLERYQRADQAEAGNLAFQALPVQNLWIQSPMGAEGDTSGRGDLPLSPALRREVWAAQAMDAQIRAALEFDPDVVWLYYVSANGFIYLAPHVPANGFHFDPVLYQQRFWLEAAPSANPSRRMILAGPYEDLGGRGWVLTFVSPVYDGANFLGVTALDLHTDTLQELTNVGDAAGESMLISENDRLIAKQSGFVPDFIVHAPRADSMLAWQEDEAGTFWLSTPILQGELWLVHKLTQRELLLAAARETLATWFMILLLCLLGVMAYRLRHALIQVTRLTYIDPLTQALNRRGFHEKVEVTLAQSERQHTPLAVLIMDIDFFKKVNDNHGHAEGDNVLKQLGGYLLKARRPFDLVCRWGGEEFVVVLPLQNAADASAVAERMRQEAQRTRTAVLFPLP